MRRKDNILWKNQSFVFCMGAFFVILMVIFFVGDSSARGVPFVQVNADPDAAIKQVSVDVTYDFD